MSQGEILTITSIIVLVDAAKKKINKKLLTSKNK